MGRARLEMGFLAMTGVGRVKIASMCEARVWCKAFVRGFR